MTTSDVGIVRDAAACVFSFCFNLVRESSVMSPLTDYIWFMTQLFTPARVFERATKRVASSFSPTIATETSPRPSMCPCDGAQFGVHTCAFSLYLGNPRTGSRAHPRPQCLRSLPCWTYGPLPRGISRRTRSVSERKRNKSCWEFRWRLTWRALGGVRLVRRWSLYISTVH